MIEVISLLAIMLISLYASWTMNAFMQLFEGIRQGARQGLIKLEFRFHIPIINCYPTGFISNKNMLDLSGGLYTGLVFLILSVISFQKGWIFFIPFTTTTIIQFVFAYHKYKYFRKLPRYIYYTECYYLLSAVIFLLLVFWLVKWWWL